MNNEKKVRQKASTRSVSEASGVRRNSREGLMDHHDMRGCMPERLKMVLDP